jgi:hypothetical protein
VGDLIAQFPAHTACLIRSVYCTNPQLFRKYWAKGVIAGVKKPLKLPLYLKDRLKLLAVS